MRGLIEAARDRLSSGASALDVAVETVVALEASRPLHRRQGRLSQRRRGL
jgi:isoaspartyl peptidase/L-asparaginase-like protein (Ntn-hydrolase superfamily)